MPKYESSLSTYKAYLHETLDDEVVKQLHKNDLEPLIVSICDQAGVLPTAERNMQIIPAIKEKFISCQNGDISFDDLVNELMKLHPDTRSL